MPILAKTARPVKSALPFGLGLEGYTVISSLPVKGDATRAVAITSHADYMSQADPAEQFPYHVREFRDGAEVYSKGYYAKAHAVGHAMIIAMPVAEEPVAAKVPAPTPAKAPVAPAVPSAHGEDSREDRAWWCALTNLLYGHNLAPICGGSPEPECGISGHWSMPGEEVEVHEESEFDYFVNRLLPEPAELSDDANGQFGYCRDSE